MADETFDASEGADTEEVAAVAVAVAVATAIAMEDMVMDEITEVEVITTAEEAHINRPGNKLRSVAVDLRTPIYTALPFFKRTNI